MFGQKIVLVNAAPIVNDMVAADPSSTVVHSLRKKQIYLHLQFQISQVLNVLDYVYKSNSVNLSKTQKQ
ncbi:hypothetical protein RGQ29_031705 [Quercus rubra]|uniref:Uncharacterized protein n=1 Tax=Quercus rubra TaxID=3512 RepID=A0AAN7EL22_QUERU|nr:hypothetical protein RGQ29_031705 [Quercus rubra]